MINKIILNKYLINLILLLGVVLSVLAYFYTETQTRKSWIDSKNSEINLLYSNFEKDVYQSILKLELTMLDIDESSDLKSYIPKHFMSIGYIDIDENNLEDLYSVSFISENRKTDLEVGKNTLKTILKDSKTNPYYYTSLDGVNLYLAFAIKLKNDTSRVAFFKAKPIIQNLTYDDYSLVVKNENNQIIYSVNPDSKTKFNVVNNYENSNIKIRVNVYLDPNGFYGLANYSNWIMIIILFITLLIVINLYRQNKKLQEINTQMREQGTSLEQAYTLFRKITSNSFDIITVVSPVLKIEYANSSYAKTLNYNPFNLQGINFVELLPEKHKDDVIRKIKSYNYNKGALSFEFELFHANKKDKIVVESMIHGVYDNHNEITNYVIHCKDITAKKESVKALLLSKRRFKDFADSSADWLWETDASLKLIFISSGINQTSGIESNNFIGKKISSLFYKSNQVVNKLIADKSIIKDLEVKIKNDAKEARWLRVSAIPVFDEKDKFTGYRGVSRDITQIKLEQDKMIELATVDCLTGLLNRSAFMQELTKTLNFANRNGIKGAILFIDLDMFKMVNESHGQDAGDKVLVEISNLLRVNLRNTDTIGRVGGDEFGVIMYDISPQEARKKINDLMDRLTTLKVYYNNEQIQVTCSIGVVKYPNKYSEPSQVLTAANLAMHKAKDMGRNRIYMTEENFFEDSFTVSAQQKMKWLNLLRTALAQGDFQMYFQPITPIKKNKTVIFESLLRLKDEDGKIVSPIFFIEAAENFGLAQTLDIAVLKRCISHHKYLQSMNKNCMISINISGMSLGDEVVLNALKDIVKKEQPDTSKIIIEVTETAAMRDEHKAKQFVAELHNLGFKFALDDFGAGYSSFYYLKNLDVDYIKIDGEFIKNLEKSKEDRYFVKALSDLAKGLDVKIIAEFVENEAHVRILKEIEIDYLQGYFISKPIDNLDNAIKNFDEKCIDEV